MLDRLETFGVEMFGTDVTGRSPPPARTVPTGPVHPNVPVRPLPATAPTMSPAVPTSIGGELTRILHIGKKRAEQLISTPRLRKL